jgi:hypothetical protein
VTRDAEIGDLLAPVLRRQFVIDGGADVRRIAGARGAEMWIHRLEDPPGTRGARTSP